ncbi:MAG: hypothetical protein H7Y27_12550 [Gemmatimonadaceae bacterium]|nr:hypothetical protein [Chitinophagaceae bacterium]
MSSILMMLTLFWLTISTPFVYTVQQKFEIGQGDHASNSLNDAEDENPFANTTEEKTTNSSNSFSEEYLHEPHSPIRHPEIFSVEHKPEDASIYIAFYGELISPPPDFMPV